ncbi:alpha/beta hydrolase [Kineococcus sp. NUM-3379]
MSPAVHRHRYGPHPAQVADLHVPAGGHRESAVVLVHGGFWKAGWDRSLEDLLVRDLLAAGRPVWNVDYRAADDEGGGWPGTLADVAAAVDALAGVAPAHGVRPVRTALVGHSAGGHLALWAAARHRLPAGAPGAGPALRPALVVAQAAVADLQAADALRLGAEAGRPGFAGGAVAALLGGHAPQVPERYLLADPVRLVPLGVPLLAVTGAADDVVPAEQSRRLAQAAAAAGDEVRLEVVDGEDHTAHLDPSSRVWRTAAAFLRERL